MEEYKDLLEGQENVVNIYLSKEDVKTYSKLALDNIKAEVSEIKERVDMANKLKELGTVQLDKRIHYKRK
jgi:hypothetical protein